MSRWCRDADGAGSRPGLRIEPVSPELAGPVAALFRGCFPEDPWNVAAIAEIMRIPGFFGRIGWLGKDPAGFALALDLGEECEILSLGVLPDRRRTGLGSALLDAICCEAERRGAGSVVLEVGTDNDAARALYAGSGFTVVGRRRNYYRQAARLVDALIMRVALAARRPTT